MRRNTYTAHQRQLTVSVTAATDSIKIVDDVVFYFDNCGQGILLKVPLIASNGTTAGEFDVVATSHDQWDDSTFDSEGNMFHCCRRSGHCAED